MNTYSYSLTTEEGATTFDQEIREFIEAENLIDAYSKVITIIADLNKVSFAYKWTLKTLENGYFAGVNGKNNFHYDSSCDCCADDSFDECCCDEDCSCNESVPVQDKCECECCK